MFLLVFGLTPPTVSADAPVAANAGPVQSSAPTVLVRTGEHPGYSRIVFDWLEMVGYQLERDGGQVTIQFDRQADFDLGRLQPQPARWIEGIVTGSDANGAFARLSIDDAAKLRHLRVGPKVVVDVYATRRARAASTAEKAAPPPPETTAARTSDLEPAGHTDSAAAPAPPEAGPAEAVPADEVPTRSATNAVPARKEPARPATPSTGETGGNNAAPAPKQLPESSRRLPQAPTATWTARRFVWPDATAAAVFRRGGWIWIMFDRPSGRDKRAFLLDDTDGGMAIEQLPHDQATILRFAAAPGLDPVVERDGFAWIVRPAPSPAVVAESIMPEVHADSPAAVRLVLATENPGAPLVVEDPEIGDTLVIVPLMPPGRGVAHGYDYPQFQLLESAQGIVIVPRIDDLEVASSGEGIEITTPDGLQVTPVPEAVRDRARLRSPHHLTRVFEAQSWPEELRGNAFIMRERQLRQTLAAAPEADRDAAVLESAHFYLAHALAAECLGAIAQAEEDRLSGDMIARLKLLRGACRLLMNRPNEARVDLSDARLDDVDEGALWRAASETMRGNPKVAAEEILRTGAIALDYPYPLRAPLTRLIAEAALAAGDETAAKNYLDILRSEPRGGIDFGYLAFLEGELRLLEGDYEGALVKWNEAEQGNDRSGRARAAFARIRAQLERNAISIIEAIEALDTLRYAWRGGAFEFNLLRELARLHGESGDYRAQLVTLRQAATNFPDHPHVAEVTAEMVAAFETLYLEGGADNLPPLSAIALFDEFRELTPAGERGNQIIRKLADRLVAVDLLDRAALLLEDQVRHRVRGVDQARVGAQLALVYLLDQNPKQTLHALEASTVPDMPADLGRQRKHLKARALAELQQFDEALRLLGDDDSPDADLIRANVFWKTRDWERVDHVLARLARHAGARPGEALEDHQARYVLSRAVALTLNGDEAELARLRQDYGHAMAVSPYADAFRLVAAARTESATDVRALISTDVREAEGFQAFLAAYRDRLREQSLSAIN